MVSDASPTRAGRRRVQGDARLRTLVGLLALSVPAGVGLSVLLGLEVEQH